jgi:hypothetical protein
VLLADVYMQYVVREVQKDEKNTCKNIP